jgi:hypothetical protein
MSQIEKKMWKCRAKHKCVLPTDLILLTRRKVFFFSCMSSVMRYACSCIMLQSVSFLAYLDKMEG